MTTPSISCEARKISYRQSKDGLVVSFVVHPNDMPDALALAPLGQRYMLALAAIGDDEKPVAPLTTPRVTASERGKQRYATASDMEKALVRSARLPKNTRFRGWVARQRWNGVDDDLSAEDTAVKHIRETCCAGESRKLIAEDRACYEAFIRMETSYLIETGILGAPR